MSHKIEVKIGESSFAAEGTADAVQQQYDQFLKAVAGSADVSELSAEILGTVFEPHKNPKLIVLKKKPKDEAQAALVLLYGYRALRNLQAASSGYVGFSLKASGFQIASRLDRLLAKYEAFITQLGEKKGSRYGLTNEGIYAARNAIIRLAKS